MAEVIFLTVRNEVMSLKRLYLHIYNYSVQITFFSKIPNYLTFINEYMRRFSWTFVTFVSCENVYGGSYKKMATSHSLAHLRKYSLIANDHFTIVINKHSVIITHVHFSRSAHKNNLSTVNHKRSLSGDKGYLSDLANSNWFDYLESLPELAEIIWRFKVSRPNLKLTWTVINHCRRQPYFFYIEHLSDTGYWLDVCHGWFHLHGLPQTARSGSYSTDQSKVKFFRLQFTVNSLSTRQL